MAEEAKQTFGDRFIVINGSMLKKNPSKEMRKIEERIFNNKWFFVRKKFIKQKSGLFCFRRKRL